MTRLLRSIQAIVAQLVAPTAYHALVRYRVVQIQAGADGVPRCELQIVNRGTGFPSTLPLSMQAGGPGLSGSPAAGCTVLVSFVEGDPSLPVVTHYSTPSDPAFVPVSSSLDATGTVTIGGSSSLVQIGSGSDVPTDATGRVVRVGDFLTVPGVGVVQVTGVPGKSYAKVAA